ncbi:hypothetical protein FEM48_Zijuj11G0079400 [Ziziphus jujuba var. spinosa]|uniref:Uncharacterized protein n=1 Tax=Ziziphus jujuba var. spinosa TaxID=714518 RepID=A0A978UHR5_ZIZJJ|nr:hypothetical protein FEM48_Zijuj11G0079400 [Ziziphus jujuba var. spinosa]
MREPKQKSKIIEFLDKVARPRIHLQSGASTSSNAHPETHQTNLSKPFLFLTISVPFLLLGISPFFLQSEPCKSLLIWVAPSVLAGPFSPISLTGGDIRVDQGHILERSIEQPNPMRKPKGYLRRGQKLVDPKTWSSGRHYW